MITNRVRQSGSFDVVHVKDAIGNNFVTQISNIFIIGKGKKKKSKTKHGFPFLEEKVFFSLLLKRKTRLAAKQSSK